MNTNPCLACRNPHRGPGCGGYKFGCMDHVWIEEYGATLEQWVKVREWSNGDWAQYRVRVVPLDVPPPWRLC